MHRGVHALASCMCVLMSVSHAKLSSYPLHACAYMPQPWAVAGLLSTDCHPSIPGGRVASQSGGVVDEHAERGVTASIVVGTLRQPVDNSGSPCNMVRTMILGDLNEARWWW